MQVPEHRLAEVFIELTDTLAGDFDIIDYLDRLAARCTEVLPVDACGILLADHFGVLNLVATSTDRVRLVELAQLDSRQGPCLDAFHTGQAVQCADLTEARDRWPEYADTARQAGYAAVQALPMRLRATVIGALNLFTVAPGALSPDTRALGQALAHAAALGILNHRTLAGQDTLTTQLQTALHSRVAIEQAKGYLARQLDTDLATAFTLLRRHARANNRRLTDTAVNVVNGTLDLTGHHDPPDPRQPQV